MTGLLWFLLLAALVTIASVIWLEHRRHLRDEAQYERELDQQFGGHSETTDEAPTTLLPLPPADLVGTVDSDDHPAGDWPPAGADARGLEDDRALSQDVPAADPGGRGPVAVSSLTPKQRRRAVKKGRIPRDLPGLVSPRQAGQPNLPSPVTSALSEAGVIGAGEFHPNGWSQMPGAAPGTCAACGTNHIPDPAPRGCARHEHHERIPQPIEVWDPMMRAWMPVFPTLLESARHEAHFRQWETELGSLIDGAYAWLEAAA